MPSQPQPLPNAAPSQTNSGFRYPYETEIADLPEGVQNAHRGAFQGIVDLNQALREIKSQMSTTPTTETATGSSTGSSENITTENVQNIISGGGVNNQSGNVTYTTAGQDDGKVIIFADSSAIAITLNFAVAANWYCVIFNQGSGSATLTPQQGLISGQSSLSVPGDYLALVYFDGSNFWAAIAPNATCSGTITSVIAGTGLTGGGSSGPVTLALSTPVSIADGGTGTATPGLVAGSNVTITGSWPDQTIAATGGSGSTAYTVALTGNTFPPGGGQTGTTTYTAPTTAGLFASLYDPTSPGANEFLSAFAYNQNGSVMWSIINVSSVSITLLSSTVLNIRVLV